MDGDKLIYNATVEGKPSSISFSLYDDGKISHGDDVKGDGIYSAKITVPAVENPILEINARYGDKSVSATRRLTLDISQKKPLEVVAEIIDTSPPTLKERK